MTIYVLGPFRLNTQEGVLFRGTEPVALGRRAIALLHALVQRPGALLSKTALIEVAWPGLTIEDSNLTVQISALRRVLGEVHGGDRWVETMPRRGYRFVGPVIVEAESGDMATGLPANAAPDPLPTSCYTAERRQVAAMSCELIGLSEPADDDLDTVHEAVTAQLHGISEIVTCRDGFVVNRQGNTLLVVFGYPVAREHNAELAVRAGLEICAATGARRFGARGSTECRIGIATGVVIISYRSGDAEFIPKELVGNAPVLAARLQSFARPNTVVIDTATRRLIGNLFDCRELGPMDAITSTEPVLHWQVQGVRIGESRFLALRGPALGSLIGRDEEIDLLLRRWRRAQTGDGQTVLISGEPGIGKSRLAAEFEARLDTEPHLLLRCLCSPYHRDSAFYPFADHLGRAAGFTPHDPPATKLEKLEALLACAAIQDEPVALITDLLSLPSSARHPLPNLSPQRKKERTLEALVRLLEGLARQQPVLMVFEDAHWIDPTSLELLDLAIERTRNLPILLIVTFRPEFQPLWAGLPQVTSLILSRLDRRDCGALVMQIARGRSLPDAVVHQLVDRADGVPLFIEELTKSVLESGVPLMGIPTTLHDLLMARLDRLGSARLVAQIGAAIGRQFSYRLLRAVSDLPENELRAALAQLVISELVFQRGTPPEAVCTFKHALIQDAAHDSLLRNHRQDLHVRIAEALADYSPELMDSQPDLFAQHYVEAGLIEKSVVWWGKAGYRSAERSLLAEAVAQFQKGIDQLARLPDTPVRRRQDLEFHVALGAALRIVKGFAAPETGRAFARARELWEQLDYPPEFFHVPVGQVNYHALRGELDLALRLNQELLRISDRRNDPVGRLLAHLSLAQTLLFRGDLASSRSHFEEGLALNDPSARRMYVEWGTRVGRGQGISQVSGRGNLGIVLFCLGYPDQALAEIRAINAEAKLAAHPPYLVLSQIFSAILLALAEDIAALDQQADELSAAAIEHGFPLYQAQGTIFRGWAKVRLGNVSEGINLLHTGLSAYRATGSEVWIPHYRVLLATSLEIAGQMSEAEALLQDALHNVERTGERWFEAELNRHKGELMFRQGYTERAKELYCRALSIARAQQAKMWELRAAVSLARIHRDQGHHSDAYAILAPVYGWFTEGFDTPALKQAKTLLDEVA